MGVCSSIDISREASIEVLKKMIEEDRLPDDVLSDVMNTLLRPHFYNTGPFNNSPASGDETLKSLFDC